MTLPTSTSAPPFSTPSAAPFPASGSFTPFPQPRTFEQRFCSHHQCDAAAFRRFVFWQSLPPRIRPFAKLMWACHRAFFLPDQRLVEEAAKARCVDDVQLDAHDFRQDPANRRFLRRFLRLRISTGRLITLTRNYLPQRYGGKVPRAK